MLYFQIKASVVFVKHKSPPPPLTLTLPHHTVHYNPIEKQWPNDTTCDIGTNPWENETYIANETFQHKIANIFLPIIFSICFGCSEDRLTETVLLSTHNICIGWELRKLFFCYALLTEGMITNNLSRNMRFPTMWFVPPVWSEPLLVAWIFYEC